MDQYWTYLKTAPKAILRLQNWYEIQYKAPDRIKNQFAKYIEQANYEKELIDDTIRRRRNNYTFDYSYRADTISDQLIAAQKYVDWCSIDPSSIGKKDIEELELRHLLECFFDNEDREAPLKEFQVKALIAKMEEEGEYDSRVIDEYPIVPSFITNNDKFMLWLYSDLYKMDEHLMNLIGNVKLRKNVDRRKVLSILNGCHGCQNKSDEQLYDEYYKMHNLTP